MIAGNCVIANLRGNLTRESAQLLKLCFFCVTIYFVHPCIHDVVVALFLFFCLVQMCRRDCGFFMLQNLQSYDGHGLILFEQKDILNIRMTMLYSWLTASYFLIDLKNAIGVDPGSYCNFFVFVFLFLCPNSFCELLFCSVVNLVCLHK